jgi:hypothetical protein
VQVRDAGCVLVATSTVVVPTSVDVLVVASAAIALSAEVVLDVISMVAVIESKLLDDAIVSSEGIERGEYWSRQALSSGPR